MRAALAKSIQGCTDYDLEFRRLLPDGSLAWMVARGHTSCEVRHGTSWQAARVLGVVMDITERKQAEADLTASREQLRALAARMETQIEEERTCISREIHDELGTVLTSLSMDLASLGEWTSAAWPAGAAEVQARVQVMTQLVRSAAQTVRQVSSKLRPSVLDDLGLEAAVEWQAQDFGRRTACGAN